jgi:galactonate dehydratase
MKITEIEVIAVQNPGRTFVNVLVRTDEGIVGLGEAGLQRRWKAIQGAVEHIERWMVGEDPFRIEYLWQKMFRGGFYPGDRLIGSVIAGVDIALWDIKGQALGVPIYELLGGRCRDHVECFMQPGYQPEGPSEGQDDLLRSAAVEGDPAATVELAHRCLSLGHRYFRLGPNLGKDYFDPREAVRKLVAQLRAVRASVGDALELMVDLHARLDPADAVWFCQQIEELGLYAVEDPIRSEHREGYRRIRRQTRVPLAAGEQWAHKWDFAPLIEEELIDFVRVDICIAGGITEAKKIAAMAETHLIQTLFHNPLGPVCTAGSLHLDLACPNGGPQEVLFPPAQSLPDVYECAFELRDYCLTVPNRPGLGVTLDLEAARKHPGEMTEPPHYRRRDGSFTNY